MKTDELYNRLDIFKDKIKQRLLELMNEDNVFLQKKEDEMYGKLLIKHNLREEDFYI